MAEFVETMHQWRRLCMAQGNDAIDVCSRCPLGSKSGGCVAICEGKEDDVNYPLIERVVTEWAKENPEPVYPTWRDWLRSQYSSVKQFGMTDIPESNIPADIAQKLGIEPKEG